MLGKEINEITIEINQLTASVLPDFYLDILIDPNMSINDLLYEIKDVYERGGGNIIKPVVKYVPGGNGGNVAKTLAKLGMSTTFITETSDLGIELLEHFFQPLGVKIQASATGIMASSAIFELSSKGGNKANVMFSSSGSIASFSSKTLTEEQWRTLNQSSIIVITNAQNLMMEELVERILSTVPDNTIVSVDFSDLTPHESRIEGFRERLLNHSKRPPQLIAGNENEFCMLAQDLNSTPLEAGFSLSSDFPEILFALHMADCSYLWHKKKMIASKECFSISLQHATGAGDAWHAGFLLGWQGGLSFEDTLLFANAVAAFQLSKGNMGSLDDIYQFIKDTPLKKSSN
jgi:sugar/nucleoside kinase (ribokinase family)